MDPSQDVNLARADGGFRTPSPEWTLVHRVAFRFAFSYALLFLGSFAAFFVPLTIPIALLSQVIWEALLPLVARDILGVPTPPFVSDGDGLGQWIQVGGCLLVATIVTLVWSVADRRRQHYAGLRDWLRVILRYALGIAMVTYGLGKILHLQMLPPHLAKLVQPLGDSSATSLLWIMMGSSAMYSAFTGVVEAVGGVLLFNRRTTTLGALITLGALSQVVALNLSYDVSVKLWSMNLLALTGILLAPDLQRLVQVFVFNQPSVPAEFSPLFRQAKSNRLAFRIGMICLVLTLAFRFVGLLNGRGQAYNRTPTVLFGIYDVTSFALNGEPPSPPLLTDETRWRRLVIERSGMASIRFMDDRVLDYLTSVDTTEGTVTFVANPDQTVTTAGANRLAYNPRVIEDRFEEAIEAQPEGGRELDFLRPADDLLELQGRWGNDSIVVRLQRIDESQFLLLNRGIHWIQYSPYFR